MSYLTPEEYSEKYGEGTPCDVKERMLEDLRKRIELLEGKLDELNELIKSLMEGR